RNVIVSDDDMTAPTINLGGSTGSESHALAQSFNWSASDASGLSAVSVSVTQDGNVIYTFNTASGSFNLDAYGIGTFIITVSATDGDNDSAGDSLSGSSTRQVVVTNAAPSATAQGTPLILQGSTAAFNATGSADPDGDALNYQWNFGDGTI